MTARILIARFASPLGELNLASHEGRLVHLDFEGNDARLGALLGRRFRKIEWREDGAAPPLVTRWLEAYFAGVMAALPMAEVEMIGTGFQKEVWRALLAIPPGESRSYGRLAIDLGHPRAVRAVARANALNPLAILVPCHRVLGADGSLTGYAGGLQRKRWLLDHEAKARCQEQCKS